MPVTARLSKLFYDRLGEAVTNELVDWFNQVDATYRNELRELNEANFARFDAKLEQRVVEIRGEFVQFRGEMRSEMAEFRGEIRSSLAELRGEFTSTIERSLRVQTAWFFVAWATMFATLVALELRR